MFYKNIYLLVYRPLEAGSSITVTCRIGVSIGDITCPDFTASLQ